VFLSVGSAWVVERARRPPAAEADLLSALGGHGPMSASVATHRRSPEHEDREALAYRLSLVGGQGGTRWPRQVSCVDPGGAVGSPTELRRQARLRASTSGRFAPIAAVSCDRWHRGDTRRGTPVSGGLPVAGRTGPGRPRGDAVKPGQQRQSGFALHRIVSGPPDATHAWPNSRKVLDLGGQPPPSSDRLPAGSRSKSPPGREVSMGEYSGLELRGAGRNLHRPS